MTRRYWNEDPTEIIKAYEEFGFWTWLESEKGTDEWKVFKTGEEYYEYCFKNRVYTPLNFHKNFTTCISRIAENTNKLIFIGKKGRSKYYKLNKES